MSAPELDSISSDDPEFYAKLSSVVLELRLQSAERVLRAFGWHALLPAQQRLLCEHGESLLRELIPQENRSSIAVDS